MPTDPFEDARAGAGHDRQNGNKKPPDALEVTPGDLPEGFADARSALLHAHGQSIVLKGRTLRFVLWLADHQTRLNAAYGRSGQLWLTWKGGPTPTIMGKVNIEL